MCNCGAQYSTPTVAQATFPQAQYPSSTQVQTKPPSSDYKPKVIGAGVPVNRG